MKDINDNKTVDWIDQKKPRLIETELGTEKICICCKEYWPLDDEFFYHQNRKRANGTVFKKWESACKCCYAVHYNKKTSGKRSIKSKFEVAA